MKDYTKRPNVHKFLPQWQKFLDKNGEEKTIEWLRKGNSTHITRKDRIGILQALKLVKV